MSVELEFWNVLFVLKIGQTETQLTADTGSLREKFASDHALEFRDAIEPAFQDVLNKVAANGSFVREEVRHLGYRRVEHPPIASQLISLALRRTAFLEWIADITQIDDINGIDGKVVETGLSHREELTWHDDLNVPGRRLALTINLSTNPFEGGAFQMRIKGADESHLRYKHSGLGSILIFKISPDLEHQVTPLVSGGPRRVFAGWFVSNT